MIRLTFAVVIVMAATPLYAQEINLAEGMSVTAQGFEIETNGETGVKTLIFNMAPNFDPEPAGELPSDDYARVHEGLCNGLSKANASLIAEHGVTMFRARWKWTPEQKPENVAAGITVTRTHQSDFKFDDQQRCTPVPNEVRPEDVSLTPPMGLPVHLRYIETNAETGHLDLVYNLDQPIDDLDDTKLQNVATELCILHADGVLAHRAKYYEQLDYQRVAIVFAQDQPRSVQRGFLFSVENAACVSGLSPELVDFVRNSRS